MRFGWLIGLSSLISLNVLTACASPANLPAPTLSSSATPIVATVAPEFSFSPLPLTTPAPTTFPAQSVNTDCPAPPRPVLRAEQLKLPILMYHHLHNVSANASAIVRGLSVAPNAFDDQIAYLAAHNYHTIYFSALVAYFHDGTPLPANPIILTFDDAWRDDYTVAFPALRQHCFVGTFFPPINWIGISPFTLTWGQILEMSGAGMEFGSHTVNHHLLANETADQIRAQLRDSKTALEARLGKPIVALAYPGNSYNALVVSLLPEEGYEVAVTTNASLIQSAGDLFTLHRIAIRYSDTLAAFAAKLGETRTQPAY